MHLQLLYVRILVKSIICLVVELRKRPIQPSRNTNGIHFLVPTSIYLKFQVLTQTLFLNSTEMLEGTFSLNRRQLQRFPSGIIFQMSLFGPDINMMNVSPMCRGACHLGNGVQDPKNVLIKVSQICDKHRSSGVT